MNAMLEMPPSRRVINQCEKLVPVRLGGHTITGLVAGASMRKHINTPPMGTSGVYTITNTITGCQYVGSSQNIQIRWQQHRTHLRTNTHHSRHLQNAWNKYTEAAFLFEIIEEAQPDLCIEREQYWIDCLRPIYNSSPTAQSPLGVKWSEESRKRLREATKGRPSAMKGRQHTQEAIAKMSESSKGKPGYWKGKKLPTDIVEKMRTSKTGAKINRAKGYKVPYKPRPYQSERQRGVKHNPGRIEKNRTSHLGKILSDETRTKMSEVHQGFTHTEEARTKISQAHKGKAKTPEHREHLAEAHRGKKLSVEQRTKISQAKKGKLISEETRAKMSAAQKGRIVSEETRAKLRAARLKAISNSNQEKHG